MRARRPPSDLPGDWPCARCKSCAHSCRNVPTANATRCGERLRLRRSAIGRLSLTHITSRLAVQALPPPTPPRSSPGAAQIWQVFQLRARVGPFECWTHRRYSEFVKLQDKLKRGFKHGARHGSLTIMRVEFRTQSLTQCLSLVGSCVLGSTPSLPWVRTSY